jgi:hypothetical protein
VLLNPCWELASSAKREGPLNHRGGPGAGGLFQGWGWSPCPGRGNTSGRQGAWSCYALHWSYHHPCPAKLLCRYGRGETPARSGDTRDTGSQTQPTPACSRDAGVPPGACVVNRPVPVTNPSQGSRVRFADGCLAALHALRAVGPPAWGARGAWVAALEQLERVSRPMAGQIRARLRALDSAAARCPGVMAVR